MVKPWGGGWRGKRNAAAADPPRLDRGVQHLRHPPVATLEDGPYGQAMGMRWRGKRNTAPHVIAGFMVPVHELPAIQCPTVQHFP